VKELDECGVCGGNDDCLDCAGTPHGSLEVDECGVCGGDGIPEGDCDCDGNVVDKCNVCNGNDDCLDCAGMPNGGAIEKACGCDDAESCLDACRVPYGDGSSCADCAGVPNGDSSIDECGVCAPGSDHAREDRGGDAYAPAGDDEAAFGPESGPVDGPIDGGFSSGRTPCNWNLACQFEGEMFCNAVSDEEERLPGYLGFCESCDYVGDFADKCTVARYTAVCGDDQDGDSVSGRLGPGSVEIVVPVVIGAVLLVAGAVCLRRKRTVRATQHRQSSMPTLGLDADLEE
jgi:hypothetical protein